MRQAHLLHQFFSSALRQTCSSEIPGNVEFLQEVYQECSVNPGPHHKRPGKLLDWTPRPERRAKLKTSKCVLMLHLNNLV